MSAQPRIIAQKRRPLHTAKGLKDSLLDEEIDKDLSAEFQIHNGVLVPTESFRYRSSGPGPSSSSTFQSAHSPRKSAMSSATLAAGGEGPSVSSNPRVLPGTADEVESFPCRVCNAVFLTENGLFKHGSQEHPSQINVIASDIESITREWKRRQHMQEIKERQVAGCVFVNGVWHGRPMSPGPYEYCDVCETAIRCDAPDSLERHKEMHFLEDTTALSLQCPQCAMAFPTPLLLEKHISTHKKKHFSCRYCGAKFVSWTQLQGHESEIHETKLCAHSVDSTISRASSVRRFYRAPEANMVASCYHCELSFNRADLLIKHMVTAHPGPRMEAKVSVKTMPVYGIVICGSDIFFECCNITFDNKDDFCIHRQQSHEL